MKRGSVKSILTAASASLSSLSLLPFAAAQYNPYAGLTPEQQALITQSNPELANALAQAQAQAALGSGFGGLFALGGSLLIIALVISAAFYVYMALTLRAIARKLKIENDWLAWIPVANFWIVKEAAQAPMWSFYVAIAGFVLAFIPGISVVGWVALLGVFVWWFMTMCPRLGRPQWWAYILAIPFLSPVVSAITINATLNSLIGLGGIASAVLLGILAWGNNQAATGGMPVGTAQLAKPSTPAPAPIAGMNA